MEKSCEAEQIGEKQRVVGEANNVGGKLGVEKGFMCL